MRRLTPVPTVLAVLVAGLTAVGAPTAVGQTESAVVTGQVTEAASGEPAAQVNLTLRGESRSGERVRTGTTTDSTGQYRLEVAPGTYRAAWSGVRYRPEAREITLSAGETRTVDVALGVRAYDLNEIVVESGRYERESATTTLQTIDPAAVEAQDAADVSELAPLMPGTHVQTNSRGQTIIYFRNAGDRQVGQFFDGALLNIPWDNRVDISMIPAGIVEDVTVAKGVPSVRYGANVLGGAINFQSRTLDDPGQQTEVATQFGTAEQRRASVTHLGRTGAWDYTAALQYTGRGDQPLPEGANLAFNQPPGSDRRVNTDRQILSAFARAARRFDGGAHLGISVLHVDAEQGVAPEGNVRPDQSRYWRYPLWTKSAVIASGQVPLAARTSLRGAVWGSRFAQDIDQYQSLSYRSLNETQRDRDLTAGARLIGTQELPVGSLTLALNGLTTRHHQTNVPFAGGEPRADSVSVYRQHIYSAGLEYDVRLLSWLRADVGVNLDGTATPATGPFPERDPFHAWGVTSGLRADLGGGWAVRWAAGRKSRFPTMRELFGAALGKFVPAPNLQPVTAWIGEAGVEYRGESVSVSAVPFYNRVYDTIDKRTFQSGPNEGKEQRVNLRGARIYGVEATASWRASDALHLSGHTTWSRPRSFTDDGTRKLDEKPAWLATGTARYAFPFGLSLRTQARYTGGVYARDEDNQFTQLPDALILDARIAYDLSALSTAIGGGRWDGELFARVDNLTDEAKFVGLGLPAPGRSFRAGIEISF